MKKTVMNIKTVMMSCMLMCATASLAANGVWNGTTDGFWTNSANWSAAPYPSTTDWASFTNAGNAQTTIDVSGLTSINNIIFSSPAVAAYTLGTGAANSQTLVLGDNGVITLSDTAANSQVVNAGLQLGTTMAAGTYTLNNLNTNQTLTFNRVFGAPSGGTAAGKALNINGPGNTTVLGDLWRGGASSLTLTHNSPGTLTMAGSNAVLTLNMNGGSNSVVDIGSGFLTLDNGGGTSFTSSQGGTINGTGKLWLKGAGDNSVAAGKTLVINASIISDGILEVYGNTGTFVLNATNTFPGEVQFNMAGAISVWKVGNKGALDSNLGKGTNINFNANATPGAKLIYTGAGEESDRTLIVNYNAIIDHSGTGLLKFTAPLTASGNAKTLTLQGSTAGIGELAGAIPNNAGTSLAKNGSGTWILSGANLYPGATTVNAGTLLINSPGSVVSPVTVNRGALLGGTGIVKGSVTLATGGLLAPAKLNTFGTLSITNALTLNGNGLFFDIDASNVSTDKVAVAGAMTVNGTNTVYLSFTSGIIPVGTNTLITFGSQSGSGSFVLAPGYANGYLMTEANSLSLVVTNTGIYGLTWKGNESTAWDLVTANWTNGSAAVTYTEGDAVIFDDTASNFNVTSDSAVNPGSLVFNNSASAYTVSAAIAGTTELFKFGSGTTTLSGTNTYSGPMTINGGKLTIGGAGQLGSGNYAGNVANASMFEYASSATQINSGVISGLGELLVSGSGTLTLSADNAYSGATTLSGPGTLVLSGSNTLSGATILNGSGTLIISGNNASSSGATIINAGVLKAISANALGTTAVGTTVNVGGTLELVGGLTFTAEPLALSGTLSCLTSNATYSGTITPQNGSMISVGAGLTLTVSAATAGGATINGFTKKGTGKLLFSADPNNAGTFIIEEGTVELNHTGSTDAFFVIAPGAMLRELQADKLGDNYNVTNNGTWEMWGTDKIAGLSGSGLVTRGNNTVATLTVGGNNLSGAFSGVIENGLGTMNFTKDGTGSQVLSGVNTYIGPTTVNAGLLLVNKPGSLALLSPVTVNNGAILGGNGTINGPVMLSAGGNLAPGGVNTIDTLQLGSSLMLNSGTLLFDISNVATDKVEVAAALTSFGVNTVVINGALPVGDYTLMTFASQGGPGTFALLDPSNAWLELTATSLILHVTTGSAGSSLKWAGDKSLIWDGGIVNWLNGSTPSAFSTGDAVLFDDTALNFTVNSGSAVAPASVLFNNSVNVYTVNAIIGGTASVTKYGTVNANLTGVNTYTGPTIVNQGTLAINTPGQLGSGNYAQNIVINNNATFHYASAANQVLSGVMSGSGTFTKSGASTLILSNANTRTGGTTLSGGTLIAKAFPTALGTGALTLNTASTTLELDSDTGLAFNNNATVTAAMTLKSGRLTSGAGGTNILGTLSINASTLTVSQGASVASGTAGLTFGATTLTGAPTFDVGTGTLLTLGALGGNFNFTKNGVGTLFFEKAGGRAAGNSTLTAGTLKVGNAAGLGTTGTTNVLNGGILDLAIDTTVNAHITTVNGNTTIQSDKSTPNSEGITHTLGNLTLGAFTLSVTNGPNVRVQSPFGLTFGSVTLNANALFDVANNGAGRGTLTLGAVSGNFSLTKRNVGTLNLAGKSVSTGATIVNNGRLVGVTGGASSNSTVTVQSSGPADAGAIMGVLCAGANGQWACNNLIFTNALAPATAVPALEFSFSVTPSTTVAPLLVTNKIVFATNPVVRVYLANLGNIASGTYPLMTASVTAPTNDIPALTIYGGYSGSTLSWSGKTLNLNLTGTAEEPLKWAGTGTGTWDINASGNLVWTNSATPPVAAYYREAPGSSDQVRFDDKTIGANQVITLDTEVNPLSVTVSNVLYKYTLGGSGSIAGPVALNKTAAGTLVLGTTNTYSGGTVLSGGTLALGNAAGLPVGSTLSMSGTSTLDLNGFSPTIGNISASVVGNTIIDNSVGSGTNTLLLNNQSATISALIKDGPSKAVAVGLMNNNVGTPTPFLLTAASTYSGGLTLKNATGLPSGNGTRMYVNAAVTTVGSAGNITSSPFGRGPISIGELPTDKAQIWLGGASINIHNDIIVNTSLGTDIPYAFRVDVANNNLYGKVTANADLSLSSYGTAGSVTLTNVISGAGGLKLLAGTTTLTATLTGPNTYTGKTTVNAGNLVFNSLRNVGEGPSALGAPTTVANGTIDLNATMQFNGAATTSDRVFNLTGGNGSFQNTGTGVLTLTGGFTGLNFNIMVRGVGTIVESGLMNIGNGGVVHTDSGTLILTNPNNPFFGPITVADGVISVDTVADIGQFSGLGRGDRILLGQGSGTIGKLQFTGASGGAFNRMFLVSGTTATAGGIIENTVAGQTLTLNGNIYLGASGPAPRLQLVGAGNGLVNGTINNTLSILKSGTGTWTFTGANSYTGATTVAGGTLALSGANGSIAQSLGYTITTGGTLLLDNTSANSTNRLRDATPITLNGGTLCITNNAGAMNYGEVAGALYVTNSGGTLATAEAAEGMTNTLVLASLTRTGSATLNFNGTGLGESDRNRIFIPGQPNGLIGFWATINTTNFAAYDASLGVIPASDAAYTNLYAKGPSVIPDNATLSARINELGTEGGISLEGAVFNSINTLMQNTDWQATAVAMTNKTLQVNQVMVSAGNARALTLGTEPNEGFVTPLAPGGELQLITSGADSLLTINAAVTNNATASTVNKTGPGTVVLAGRNSFTGALNVKNGTVTLAGSSTNAIGAVTVSGDSLGAALNISGPSSLGANTLLVGNETGSRSVVTLESDLSLARVTAGATDNAISAGAVYHNSGTLAATAAHISLGEGTGDFGYYRLSGGVVAPAVAGNPSIATKGYGVLEMTGGSLGLNFAMFICAQGGVAGAAGTVNIYGGLLKGSSTSDNYITMGGTASVGYGQLNVGGSGILNIAGGPSNNRGLGLMFADNNTNVVNLLPGGTIIANRVFAEKTTGRSIFNFNGGMLTTTNTSTVGATFLQGLTGAYVYPGNAFIDTTSMNLTVVQPLLTTTDYGVTSITLTNNGTGYIGAPAVVILGGSGRGATATAQHDFNTNSATFGQITGLTITCPGTGYLPGDTLTVSLRGGGFLTPAGATCSLSANPVSGGLTKFGSGVLTMSGINTYAGATTISNGTLRLGIANALPTNSVVNVDGGIFDLNGFWVTNGAVNVTSGSVMNGKLSSAGLVKDGAGVATLSVLQTTPAPIIINEGTLKLSSAAGLYEGRVNGAFELGLPNPLTAVKLCPTNAYTFFGTSAASGGIWVDNSTYIYSGVIWNRSPTNETWTFCKSFDDSVRIIVDNTPVININGNWDVVVTANYVVTPGPHAFEVRLGQGNGGVGQAANKTVPGAGFDRLGRSNSAFCVPIVDPGDGSLLTLGGKLASASTVELAANGLLDLDGTGQTLAGLSGSGTVSNGALTVTGTVSPAATNTIGTLTVKGNTTLSGKLLVNVATDGTSDCLDVQGNLNLLSPTLEIANLAGLSTLKMYTLVTYTGELTGLFTPTNLPDRWTLRYTTDKKVQLYYKGGTMVRIM